MDIIPPNITDIYRYEDSTHGSRGADLAWRLTPTNAIGKVYLDAYNAQTMNQHNRRWSNARIFPNRCPCYRNVFGDIWIDGHNPSYY